MLRYKSKVKHEIFNFVYSTPTCPCHDQKIKILIIFQSHHKYLLTLTNKECFFGYVSMLFKSQLAMLFSKILCLCVDLQLLNFYQCFKIDLILKILNFCSWSILELCWWDANLFSNLANKIPIYFCLK